jgi:hypothetical protein
MRRLVLVVVGTLTGAVLATGASTALAAPAASSCTGTLASGTYNKLIVPPGATCDGTAANVRVRGGLQVGQGATFILGSEGSTNTGTISGGVHATNAASVQIHFATINGGIDLRGGSGPGPVGGSEEDVNFNAIEDNNIHGGATVQGYDGFWFGFIRNHVSGSVNLNDNVLADPDGNEYVTNTIKGNLVCHDNSPAPQVGDSEGQPNVVTGRKIDQCAGL